MLLFNVCTQTHVQVLGGRVEALAEAYEFAQRYANMERSKGGDNDLDRAPTFKTFVPGVHTAELALWV